LYIIKDSTFFKFIYILFTLILR